MSFPKAIFFDAVGTLFHLPRGVGFHYHAVAKRHGFPVEEEQLSKAFRAVWHSIPTPDATCVPRPDDDKSWWRELAMQVLELSGIDDAKARAGDYFEDLYSEFTRPGVWELYPEVLEVLAALEDRCTLAVVSNFDGRLRTILPQLGIGHYFQHIIISSEVGADKPHPWIFSRALALSGVHPQDALHVGDEPESDWVGAESAGLQVFRLERPHSSLRDVLK
jgi:putative hydrolase of the HAD superfamily